MYILKSLFQSFILVSINILQIYLCFSSPLLLCILQLLAYHSSVSSPHREVVNKLDGTQNARTQKETQYTPDRHDNIQVRAQGLTTILVCGPHGHRNNQSAVICIGP